MQAVSTRSGHGLTVCTRSEIRPHGWFALSAAAVLLAGCGGGGETHAFADVGPCISDRASNVIGSTNEADPNLDFVAEDAGDGALEAEIGRNTVTVVVERNGNDAEDTLNAYESFGDGVHERHGNVVLVWSKTPTDDEREAVESCLDG